LPDHGRSEEDEDEAREEGLAVKGSDRTHAEQGVLMVCGSGG
jgi:hypothetical protein